MITPTRHPAHLALVAALAACGAPSIAGPPETLAEATTRGFVSDPDSSAPDLAYVFRPSGEALIVSAAFTGDADGCTLVGLDRWAGVADPGAWVTALRTAGKGEVTVVDATPGRRRWEVRHAPSARVELEYRFEPPLAPSLEDEHLFPKVTADRVRFEGDTTLITPRSERYEEAELRIAWSWAGVEGWQMATSFGMGPSGETTARLDDFTHAVFHAGAETRVVRADGLRPIILVIDGHWSFSDIDLAQTLATIASAQITLMDDAHTAEQNPFVVSFCPYREPPTKGSSFAGTGLTDAFLAVADPSASLDPSTRGGKRLLHLLAHEMFHEFNGRRIARTPPERRVYWFSEGFTELMTYRSLVFSGLLSPSDAQEAGHRLLKAYDESPVRDMPNAVVEKRFWSDPAVSKLPYQRGFAVALWLDRTIAELSAGRRDSVAFMQDVLVAADERGEKVSLDGLLERVERWTSAEHAARFRAVIVDGAALPPGLENHLEPMFARSTGPQMRRELP